MRRLSTPAMWRIAMLKMVRVCCFVYAGACCKVSPLSGTLFASIVEPFLAPVSTLLKFPELIWACADDLLAIRASMDSVRRLSAIFKLFRYFADLHLKITKCCVIPIGAAPTHHTSDAYRNLMKMRVPDWAAAAVTFSWTYLGVGIGPLAGSMRWIVAIKKWIERTGNHSISSVLITAHHHLQREVGFDIELHLANIGCPCRCAREGVGAVAPIVEDASADIAHEWLRCNEGCRTDSPSVYSHHIQSCSRTFLSEVHTRQVATC
jgi:hypothetical protein